jgi:multidrug efflux system membrane fusion protein
LIAEAWDRGDTQLQATGVLQSLDNQINVTTGTLKFKARYENRDQVLFPNQFVNVHLLADTLKGVVLAPSAAIQFGTNGTFVYAMDGDKKVTIRQLKVGASDGQNTVVTEGLAPGDRVVLEGTDRLKEGSEVEVVNDTKDVPTTPTGHLQGKSAASSTEPATTTDKAKKDGA